MPQLSLGLFVGLETKPGNELEVERPDEAGRQAHLSRRVAAALMTIAPELLSLPPSIEQVDVLAAKLPKQAAWT